MKRWFAILMTMLLLLSLSACVETDVPEEEPENLEAEVVEEQEAVPEPEPEAEVPDAKELWAAAEAAAENYTSLEVQNRSEIHSEILGKETILKNTTIIRGKDLDSRLMQYESVTTGDSPRELYYRNGIVHLDDGIHQYNCGLGADYFREYLKETTLPIRAQYFQKVELVSDENGCELAFSDPTEEFVDVFKNVICGGALMLKDDTLLASGTVLLDEAGCYDSVKLELSCTLICGGTEEMTYGVITTDRYMSYNEPVTVIIPSKVESFVDIVDIRMTDRLNSASSMLVLISAADYRELLTFSGTIGGAPYELSETYHTIFRRELDGSDVQFAEDYELSVIKDGVEERTTSRTDYVDGLYRYTDDAGILEEQIEEVYMYSHILSDVGWLVTEHYPEELFYYPRAESKDGIYTVSAYCTGNVGYALYHTVLCYTHPELADSLYEVDGSWEIYKTKLLIDEETKMVRAVEYDVTCSFILPDGTEITGDVHYEKVYDAYDTDVVFAPGSGVSQEM